MPTAISAPEDSSLSSLAATGVRAVTEDAHTERRREFENILSHALPRFRRIAMRSLRNHEDAEDAVQDAMLSAFRHIAQFDGRAQMSTWLTAIVINAVRMQLRRRSQRQVVSLDQSPEEGQSAIAEMLADPRPTPEQTLEYCEVRELVVKLTSRLPRAQQAALKLRQRDGVSIKNAAKTLGIPEGTVKAQLTRGRAKLMERFRATMVKRKSATLGLDSKIRSKAFSTRYQGDRAQSMTHLPAAVFRQQAGGEAWMGA
jgi:RNA polymerase sigma-70 factor, ECF subfamily